MLGGLTAAILLASTNTSIWVKKEAPFEESSNLSGESQAGVGGLE
jgi:hypothetical protein